MHSILDSRTDRKKIEKYLARELEALDTEGCPPVPVLGTGLYIAEGMLVDHQELHGRGDPVFGMAGFASYDDIITALSVNGTGELSQFYKTGLVTTAGNLFSLWAAGGYPTSGTFGTSLTGRAVDNTFTASMAFTNAAAGTNKHMLSAGVGSTVSLGSVLFYDRIYEYPFTGTATSGTFSVPTLVTRDMAGASAGAAQMMFHENFSNTATAAVTVTPTYTNSAGTGSRTNAYTSIATSAVGGTVANPVGRIFLPLAAGDKGVRSIQSYTLSASLLAANQNFVIGRPLTLLPMLASNSYVQRDLVLQLANMPRLYDGTAIAHMVLANTTSSLCWGDTLMAEK